MTGGGFGGCALVLTGPGGVTEVREAVDAEFGRRGFAVPGVHVVASADGARRVEVQ
jgi:galactokinase